MRMVLALALTLTLAAHGDAGGKMPGTHTAISIRGTTPETTLATHKWIGSINRNSITAHICIPPILLCTTLHVRDIMLRLILSRLWW